MVEKKRKEMLDKLKQVAGVSIRFPYVPHRPFSWRKELTVGDPSCISDSVCGSTWFSCGALCKSPRHMCTLTDCKSSREQGPGMRN